MGSRQRFNNRVVICHDKLLPAAATLWPHLLWVCGTVKPASLSEFAMRFLSRRSLITSFKNYRPASTCGVFLAASTCSLFSPLHAAPAVINSAPIAAPDNRGWENSFTWEDNDESAWTWRGDLSANAPFETRLIFARISERDYQMLLLKSDGKQIKAQFWRAQNGKLSPVGQDGASQVLSANAQLSLQHTSARTRALWNGAVVAQMWGEIPQGSWGVASQGAKIESARVQPWEATYFSDDFMRAESPDEKENPGQWTRVSGEWKTSGLLGQRADAALNPNPFVFRASLTDATKTQTALTTAGQWFWSDYAVAAAVKPMLHDANAPLVAALNAYVQKDGTRVSGEVDFRTGRATIKRGSKVLGASAAFEVDPDQWHRIYLDPGPGTLRLLVDGVERVRVDGESSEGDLAQGPLALSANTGGANTIDFDDVRAVPTDATSDQFAHAIVGRWDDWQGVWQTQAQNKSGRRVALSAGSALSLTGGSEREEGLVEATFALSDKNSVPAVVFAARDAKNFYAARLRAGQLEIVEVNADTPRLLSATKATFGLTPKIEIEWRDGIITARAGSASTMATVASVPAGRVGVWSVGTAKSVALTSFRALGAAPSWGEGALPERFAKDVLMKNWASNAAAWKRGSDGTWWHVGDFFGDSALTLPLPKLPDGGTLTLRLAANPANSESGAQVKIARAGTNWQWTLSQNGKTLDTQTLADADWKDEVRTVRFVRRPLDSERALLRVAANGRALMSQTTQSSKVDGIKSGVTWGGTIPTPPKGNVINIELTTTEREKRAYVGVRLAEITPPLQKDLDYDGKGAFIQGVEAASPALKAGLKDNDIVQNVDGKAVDSAEQIIAQVQTKKPGEKVALQIWRPAVVQSVVDWENTLATTTQALDYTFTSAPVDWQATQGKWEVAERWTCSPQWAFFVGSNAVNPTLWSRFGTRDDWTLEAYVATPMDLTRGERSPIDLNLTVAGDGRDLASGYSFVFGGENRTVSRIYRGDKIVLEKPFELPPGSDNTHQDWFYVRVERRRTPQGLNFKYSVNNRVVMEFTDPQPLDSGKSGGRFAFWTYNGGLSIARARLWYQNLSPATAPLLTAQKPEIVPVVTPVKNALDEWAPRRDDVLKISSRVQEISEAGKNGVKIVNPQSGGDWTTYVSRRAYDAKARPILGFDYRIGSDALVNVYVKIDNRWREIGFTGNGTVSPAAADELGNTSLAPFDDAPNRPAITAGFAPLPAMPVDSSVVLGQIADVKADRQWHHAQFDLLSALRQANLGTAVQEIAFAAPNQDYVLCGLGGNHLGASYEIANFQGDKIGAAGAQMAAR